MGVDEKIVVQPAASAMSLALHLQQRCLSPGKKASEPDGLKGRTFDLKWAFKQLGIDPVDLPFAKVAVWDPVSCQPAVLALKALPFGATRSVHGFSRCSLAIWQVAVSLLLLPLTVFFDDYTSTCFLLLLKLLGWQAALSGSKAQTFAQSFVSLGIAYISYQGHQQASCASVTQTRAKERLPQRASEPCRQESCLQPSA